MSGKTELRQATLISQQKVVPGTGTLTGITVSDPLTGGGAGPVVPLGIKQFDAANKGYVPSPGVNNHTLVLFDDGWFAPPSVTFPISVAHGGTGADLSGLDPGQLVAFDGTKFAGVAVTVSDTAAGGNPGADITGGLVVTERLMALGGAFAAASHADGGIQAVGPEFGVSSDYNTTGVAQLTVTQPVLSNTAAPVFVSLFGSDAGNGNSVRAALGAYEPDGTDTDNVLFLLPNDPTTNDFLDGNFGSFFVGGINTEGNTGYLSINADNTGYFRATAGVDIRGGAVLTAGSAPIPLLSSSSSNHVSIFAQTSATDGSNTNPTLVVAGNTGQRAPVLETRGNDGTTPDTQLYGGGMAAIASIGSGADGTVNLVADDPGVIGNAFTVEVASGAPTLNVNLSAVYTGFALLVTLGTDGAGVLDPTKNTATLVAGAINTAAGGLTATASGTGADPITAAEGPHTFTGGKEAVTVAGGAAFGASVVRSDQGLWTNGDLAVFSLASSSNLTILASAGLDGLESGGSGMLTLQTSDGSSHNSAYAIQGSSGLHAWDSSDGIGGTKEMTFDNTGLLTVPGNVGAVSYSVADMNSAPASAGASGVKGEIRWTDGFVYLCTATNTWKRAELTTWV